MSHIDKDSCRPHSHRALHDRHAYGFCWCRWHVWLDSGDRINTNTNSNIFTLRRTRLRTDYPVTHTVCTARRSAPRRAWSRGAAAPARAGVVRVAASVRPRPPRGPPSARLFRSFHCFITHTPTCLTPHRAGWIVDARPCYQDTRPSHLPPRRPGCAHRAAPMLTSRRCILDASPLLV